MAESENIAQLKDFFKSSDFKNVLKEVVDEAVERATAPLLRRIAMLEAQLIEAKQHANDNEQYVRKYNLRFIGLEEEDDENCRDKIIDFCKDTLDTDINVQEIDRAHRVGPKKPETARPILVKFKSYDAKMMVKKKKRRSEGKSNLH